VDKCRPAEKSCEVRRAEDELRPREQRAEFEVLMWRLVREMTYQEYPDRYEAG
jgi:hypothetical protein